MRWKEESEDEEMEKESEGGGRFEGVGRCGVGGRRESK